MRTFARSILRASATAFVLSLIGCGATFEDERPAPSASGPDETPSEDTGVPAARGTFEGRDGHLGQGTAELALFGDGSSVLQFSADFTVSNTPSLTVVLTTRDAIGTRIDSSVDREIAQLRSRTGEQSYDIGADDGRRQLFIFCKSFGVEVAKATLIDL